MENKINIEECYFHGLAGGIPFWDIDRVTVIGLQQLKNIINNKGIYSRKILKEKYGINYEEKEAKYNGEDYISICIKNPKDDEFLGDNIGVDSDFFRYVQHKIGIALDSDILNKCEFRKEKYKRLPGERQVLNNIDISNFKAIVIGMKNDKCIQQVQKILEGTNIPIIDIEGNIMSSIKNDKEKDLEI